MTPGKRDAVKRGRAILCPYLDFLDSAVGCAAWVWGGVSIAVVKHGATRGSCWVCMRD